MSRDLVWSIHTSGMHGLSAKLGFAHHETVVARSLRRR